MDMYMHKHIHIKYLEGFYFSIASMRVEVAKET